MITNYVTEKVHISMVGAGDTILHNGVIKTVCKCNIKRDGFMGLTLFGDSYKGGREMVDKVFFTCNGKRIVK